MRESACERRTTESDVTVRIALDAASAPEIETPVPFFSHMLSQWAFHSGCTLAIRARSLDAIAHHVIEDMALALGTAVRDALGQRSGIVRFGWAVVPMDEALARVAVDLSGRPFARTSLPALPHVIEGVERDMIPHFFASVAASGGLTIHADVLAGENAHHCVEALFKAAGIAFAAAWRADERRAGIRSTKGTLQ